MITYDKSRDPNRVDEATVRKLVHDGSPYLEYSVVQQGRFRPGGAGHCAPVDVVCFRDDEDCPFGSEKGGKNWSVHTAVVRAEERGVVSIGLTEGEYDYTAAEATERLKLR